MAKKKLAPKKKVVAKLPLKLKGKKAARQALAKDEAGKLLRKVEKAARENKLSAFNHAGRMRGVLRPLARGDSVTDRQFRDASKPSAEIPGPQMAGRHEIAPTAVRAKVAGNEVAVAFAAAGRTSTSLAALRAGNYKVVAHTGYAVSGLSTEGQADAHQPLNAFAAKLKSVKDPHVAVAMGAEAALSSLSRARLLRTDKRITGMETTIIGGKIEAPQKGRGNDDGYESDTARGRVVRRFAVAEIHLKNSLRALRKISPNARNRTRSPSPNPKRGGLGNGGSPAAKLPSVKGLSKADKTTELTNFTFLAFQTLKK